MNARTATSHPANVAPSGSPEKNPRPEKNISGTLNTSISVRRLRCQDRSNPSATGDTSRGGRSIMFD